MKKSDKVKNIIAFLAVMFNEDLEFVKWLSTKHPEYILEKFMRYVEYEDIAWEWGLHPALKIRLFDEWVRKNAEKLLAMDEGYDS